MNNDNVKSTSHKQDDGTIIVNVDMESLGKEIERCIRQDKIQKIAFWAIMISSLSLIIFVMALLIGLV